MIDLNLNPVISSPDQPTIIQFAQTRDTLIDTEIYSRFIYSVENQFRRSRFYKSYKGNLMNKGLNFDQFMRGITDEHADVEMHHQLPTLNMAAIMICETYLNTKGYVTTFDIIKDLEEAHRNNMMNVVMLTSTNHQAYHNDPSAFISLNMGYGDPFLFLEKYKIGLTLDICFKWLLQLKMEEQFGNISTWVNAPRARETLLSWQETASTIDY